MLKLNNKNAGNLNRILPPAVINLMCFLCTVQCMFLTCHEQVCFYVINKEMKYYICHLAPYCENKVLYSRAISMTYLLSVNRPNVLLFLCVVILQLWCIRSWFCWLRSSGEATLFWRGFPVRPFKSARAPAVAAAARVCPACPCHGIYASLNKYILLLFCPILISQACVLHC